MAVAAEEVGAEEGEEVAGADSHEIQFSGKSRYPLFHVRAIFLRRMLYSSDGSLDVDVIGK